VSKKLEKLGWHASDTSELSFSDVFVPEDNLLGEETAASTVCRSGSGFAGGLLTRR